MQQSPRDLAKQTDSGANLHEIVRRVEGPVRQGEGSPSSGHSSSLLAKRYELKYRIPESTAFALRSVIRSYLDVDKYAVGQPGNQYEICSLYLDSPRFDLFHETVLDKCNRFKLRVRGYDDDPESPLFLEIKRKLNNIIFKSRAKIDKDQLKPILNGYYVPRNLPEKDRNTLKQFMHYCQCLQARPKALVRYMREAYENESDSRVRITFDRALKYKYVNDSIYTLNGHGWNTVPIDFVILEIKFTSSFPSWLKDMVRMFELSRQSMSKYCSSVRRLVPRGSIYYKMPQR